MTADLSALIAREPYQPSCGFEGAAFMARFCDQCVHDAAFRDGTGDSCTIAANTMVYDVDDDAYPVEWREDGPHGPRCTAFEREQAAVNKNPKAQEG